MALRSRGRDARIGGLGEASVALHAALRDRHPAWRLLASPHAPLVASFLHRAYVAPNVRVMSEADLAEALEDELFALREQLGTDAYPKGAQDYLNDWAAPDKGWLRKFYKPGTDEAQFDLLAQLAGHLPHHALQARHQALERHHAGARQAFLQVAERHVERAGREQQQEHRLAHRVERDGQQAALLSAGQGVGSVHGKARRSVVRAQASPGDGGRCRGGRFRGGGLGWGQGHAQG